MMKLDPAPQSWGSRRQTERKRHHNRYFNRNSNLLPSSFSFSSGIFFRETHLDREALLSKRAMVRISFHFLEARSGKNWFWDWHEFEYKAAGIEITNFWLMKEIINSRSRNIPNLGTVRTIRIS